LFAQVPEIYSIKVLEDKCPHSVSLSQSQDAFRL
jgi:hypothetical protein